jgi:CreA protein
MNRCLILILAACCLAAPARAAEIGCVSTTFRMLGLANDKICIDAFRDPKVDGVVCHVSRAKTGGVTGAVGLAEDTSDAAVSCRQVGPIRFRVSIEDKEEVFNESRSVLFKRLHVVRFYDRANRTLVYLSYSDKLVEGSPKHSISTVPIMPWGK